MQMTKCNDYVKMKHGHKVKRISKIISEPRKEYMMENDDNFYIEHTDFEKIDGIPKHWIGDTIPQMTGIVKEVFMSGDTFVYMLDDGVDYIYVQET